MLSKYNICAANRTVNGQQHKIIWHVDDSKLRHKDSKVNKNFLICLLNKYANDKISNVKASQGKQHEYLGMMLDCNKKGKHKVDMGDYIDEIIK